MAGEARHSQIRAQDQRVRQRVRLAGKPVVVRLAESLPEELRGSQRPGAEQLLAGARQSSGLAGKLRGKPAGGVLGPGEAGASTPNKRARGSPPEYWPARE